jgi:hypothetical protein
MDIKLLREVVRGSTHTFDMVKDGVKHISSTQKARCESNIDNCEDPLNVLEDLQNVVSY